MLDRVTCTCVELRLKLQLAVNWEEKQIPLLKLS
jgi:hypothetical protein